MSTQHMVHAPGSKITIAMEIVDSGRIVKTIVDNERQCDVPAWVLTRENSQTSQGILPAFSSEVIINTGQHVKALISGGKAESVLTWKEGIRARESASLEVDFKGNLKMYKKIEAKNGIEEIEVSWTTFGKRLEVPKVVLFA